ncbi:hypothetical protein CA984_22425 [Streptosporangium minutum]|uniref:Uncharacterized protein n=1 Tax=Streptosporangium minutum TaxID=569862 RepID=A0A243RJY4_9ACTN|nr:hypothetical protein CA984_22425 [Streptosporangium minutum]
MESGVVDSGINRSVDSEGDRCLSRATASLATGTCAAGLTQAQNRRSSVLDFSECTVADAERLTEWLTQQVCRRRAGP